MPTNSQQAALRWTVLGAAVIVAITIIGYLPAIGAQYIWDDESYVTENRLLRDLDGLRRIWIPRQTPQYYPVVFTTFWIEYQVWELRPMGYHIVNVLLHAANALLVWRLGVVLGIGGAGRPGAALRFAPAWFRFAPAWVIGAAFAVHPVHVESVAWITERKNVLSGLFYLLAALAYLRFDQMQFESDADEQPRESWGWYGASLVLFGLAMLSKSVTCSLPAAIMLMLLYQRKRLTWFRVALLAPMFALGLWLALNTAVIEREHVGAEGPNFAFSFADRLLIASKALLFYPSKIVVPWPLMFVYPRWTIDDHDVISYWSVAVAMLIAAGAVWMYIKGWRGVPLALAFYAGTIFPALGFFNVYPMLFSFVADHFQYLASLGVIAAIVGSLAWLLRSARALLIISAVILPALAALTWQQARTYENAETVWNDTLRKNPNSWMPHNNMASLMLRRAEEALKTNPSADPRAFTDQVIVHAREALDNKPDHEKAFTNLSEGLRLQGRYQEALEPALKAAELMPHMAGNHWMVGRIYQLLKDNDQAIAAYQSALKNDPYHRESHVELALLLMTMGSVDEALPHAEQAIKSGPGDGRFILRMAQRLDQAGRYDLAERHYRLALSAARDDAARIDAGYHLARFLALCPDAARRKGIEALELAEEICRLTNRQSPFPLGILAAAYAESGRFEEAVRTGEEALALARMVQQNDLANELELQLKFYRAGQRAP